MRSQRRDRAGVTPASIFTGRAGTRIPSLYYVSGKKASSGRLESILVIDRSSEKVYTGATIELCVPGYGDTRCIEKGMQCKSAAAPATVTGTDHPSDATGKPGRRRGRMNWSQETCHICRVLFFRRERRERAVAVKPQRFDVVQHQVGSCPPFYALKASLFVERGEQGCFFMPCFLINARQRRGLSNHETTYVPAMGIGLRYLNHSGEIEERTRECDDLSGVYNHSRCCGETAHRISRPHIINK